MISPSLKLEEIKYQTLPIWFRSKSVCFTAKCDAVFIMKINRFQIHSRQSKPADCADKADFRAFPAISRIFTAAFRSEETRLIQCVKETKLPEAR